MRPTRSTSNLRWLLRVIRALSYLNDLLLGMDFGVDFGVDVCLLFRVDFGMDFAFDFTG